LYGPLWAAVQALDLPLGMHIATNRPGPGQDFALEDRNRVRNSLAYLATTTDNLMSLMWSLTVF